ncbi:MAG: hypothetical protein QOI08_4424 [Actinomycetota bacterium]|nr:hypothetical protein [Actinomycetota bacterium]
MAKNRSRNPRISSATELPEELLDFATSAGRTHEFLRLRAVEQLAALDPAAVNRAAERQVLARIDSAWNLGWQPRELVRQIRRAADAPTVGLALVAIAAERAGNQAFRLDPRWASQLTGLELPPAVPGHWMATWTLEVERTRPEQIRVVVALLRCLAGISRIPTLIPPPGARRVDDTIIDLDSKRDDPMLDRVRALLAQAESTQYEAEAETFTAKAQELMTRHAIDMAMLSSGARRAERPQTIRIGIDEPYVDAKSLLLQFVAESSRCRAVFHERFAMSSVVGFAADLDAAETLFTSLLVQAQVAMQAAASTAPPGTRTRSRSFRTAFLMAYACRVAERLAEINRYVVADAEAETGQSITPVLAARSSVVDETVGEIFGRLRSTTVRRGFDAEGWAGGRSAADRARLGAGHLDRAGASPATPLASASSSPATHRVGRRGADG